MSGTNLRKLIIDDVTSDAFDDVDVQYPLPTDSDSVYAKDVWEGASVTTGWVEFGSTTGLDLSIIPFTNLHTVIKYSGTDNPKVLLIHFNRTVSLSQVSLGAHTGNFSNIKLELLGSALAVRDTVDLSGDSTKRTSLRIPFEPQLTNAIRLSFLTADDVSLSNITIQKTTVVAAQLQGIKDDLTLVNIGASNAGNLKITDAENGLAIASGEVAGKTFIHKFGNAPDFDTTDGSVTIWDGADDGNINQMVYQYSTSNDIDTLSSSNNGDTQEVEIQGLYDDGSGNWILHTQTATLTGQTQVILSQPLIRVFRMKNINSTDFAGYIYCYVNGTATAGVPDTPADVRAIVQNGNNQTLMAVYTVPSGKTGYMRDWFAAIAGANKTSNYVIDLFARPEGQVFQLKHRSALADSGTSYIQHTYVEPEVFAEKTDIEMKVSASAVGATAASVSGGFDIVLIDD